MAFRTKKISQMDPKGAPLASTDLLEISELVSGSYVTKSITGAEIITGATTGFVPSTRTLTTTAPLTGGGDLSANRTLAIPKATTAVDGYLSATDWTTFNGKQNALGFTPVPTTRTLTINGTTQDLSADRTFTVSTGITIGTTAITSGVVGRVLFEGTGNVVQESGNLFWDNVNGRLGIGGTPGAFNLDVVGTARVASSVGQTLIVQSSLDSSFTAIAEFNASALSTSRTGFIAIGRNGATNNQASLGFFYSGNSSNANRLDFGFFGTSPRMTILAGGNVGINTTTDAGYKLDVNGTARFKGSGALDIFNVQSSTGAEAMVVYADRAVYINGNNTLGYTTNIKLGGQPNQANLSFFGNNNIYVGQGNSVENIPTALFAMGSTTKGFLPPRMTTTQKNAIATPAAGLMVYDTTLNLIALYNGTTWITL